MIDAQPENAIVAASKIGLNQVFIGLAAFF